MTHGGRQDPTLSIGVVADVHEMGAAKYVDVDGVPTRYFDTGSGHPLVLVHGGDFRSLSSADDWSRNAPALSEHFRVISLDKLGQGFTGLPASRSHYTMTATAQHLLGFVQALGLTDVTLVGHSRGALPAAWIAVEHPELVRSLVIFSSNTLAADHPATPRDFYPSTFRNRTVPPSREYVRAEPVANSYDSAHVDADLVARRTEIGGLSKFDQGARVMAELFTEQYVPDHQRLRTEVLARIDAGGVRCPVSIIWGRNDVSAPVVIGDQLAAQVAAATEVTDYHVINHAAHYVYREHPETCNALVRTFVDGVLRATPGARR